MTKEQENEAIAAHHMPIRIKELEARVATLTEALDLYRETLRDQFAMAALTGLLSQPEAITVPVATAASDAYEYADAMLEARQK